MLRSDPKAAWQGGQILRTYVPGLLMRPQHHELRVLAALLEDHANVEPRIPMARARARARGAAGRFWPN